MKPGEAAKFHRKWKGPYEVLECTTEVNYRIKKLQDPPSHSKVVHFDNLKLYQQRNPEMNVRRRKQTGIQGSLEKEREDVLESPEGRGIICRDDLSEDRDIDELPDFCLPIPTPVETGHQVILDPENDGTHKVDDNQPNTNLPTANGVEDIDGTPRSDDHPEAHLPPGNQVGEVGPVLDVQSNPNAMGDLGVNTTHTMQEIEQKSTLIGDGSVELAEKKLSGVTWLGLGSLPEKHHLLPRARRE